MNIDTHIQTFLEHLEITRGRSQKTIENYSRYLNRFAKELNIKEVSQITKEDVDRFRIILNRGGEKNKPVQIKTQNYYLIALRAFLKYLRSEDIKTLQPEKILLAKTHDREIIIMTKDEIRRLLLTPEKETPDDIRDKALLMTLISTGLRVSELCSLPRNLDISSSEYSMRGKGGKIRVIFFSQETKELIQKYIKEREDMSSALFVSSKGNPLTPRAVERIVEKRVKQAGISKHITPHGLRHAFATTLLQNGADIRSVQELLGHSHINTTQVYTHVTNKRLREAHETFFDI